ncbi:MAG: T9SS type A sorting domain-containing protein [Bacteroidales bacterium]|nr:T9SS type A sorting domain-containing protein [Bacteroidales bacterium]
MWIGGSEDPVAYKPELIIDDQPDQDVKSPLFDRNGGSYKIEDAAYRNTVALLSNHGVKDKVFFTVDGSMPDSSKEVFPLTQLQLFETSVLKAVTYRFDDTNAVVAISDTFVSDTFFFRVNEDKISLTGASSAYDSLLIGISNQHSTPGIQFYYTTDGNTPDQNSNLYSEPFWIYDTIDFMVVGILDGFVNSNIKTKNYVITPSIKAPRILPNIQDQIDSVMVEILDTNSFDGNRTIYYTLDGTDPVDTSMVYSEPFKLVYDQNVFFIQVKAAIYGNSPGYWSPVAVQNFVIRLSSLKDHLSVNMKAYPVPVTDRLNIINSEFNGPVQVKILNLRGDIVYLETVATSLNTEINTDFSSFAAGIYIVQINDNKKVSLLKVIKE